jgi:hypothetical protein
MTTCGAGKAPASERKSHSVYVDTLDHFFVVYFREEKDGAKKTRIGKIERRVKWKEQSDLDAETMMRADSATVGAHCCADACRDQIRPLDLLLFITTIIIFNVSR